MKINLVLLAAALFLTSTLFAKEVDYVTGIKKATKIIKINRDDVDSGITGVSSVQKCYVFPEFLAIEVDSNQKGSFSIAIRKRDKKKKLDSLCKEIDSPNDHIIANNEQYVLGARGHYLFTISADLFGDLGNVWIYDGLTGKQLYDAPFSVAHDFIVKEKHKALSIEFYRQLNLPCSLWGENQACWAKILKANEVPDIVNIAIPDCLKVYDGEEFKNSPKLHEIPDAIQVFTKVVVEDIDLPIHKFLNGKPTCNMTP